LLVGTNIALFFILFAVKKKAHTLWPSICRGSNFCIKITCA